MANWWQHWQTSKHKGLKDFVLKKNEAPKNAIGQEWLLKLKDFITEKVGKEFAQQIFEG